MDSISFLEELQSDIAKTRVGRDEHLWSFCNLPQAEPAPYLSVTHGKIIGPDLWEDNQ